jgi:predicted glycogen debranching enzyme
MYRFDEQQCRNFELSSSREWMLPNGLGGYAMGTVSGMNTRRYHGHLVAAVKPPTERMVLLANIECLVEGDGQPVGLSTNRYVGATHPEGYQYLTSFAVGERQAVWRYRVTSLELEKVLIAHKGENACTIRYRNTGKKPLQLTLRPLVSHKFYHGQFSSSDHYPERLDFPHDETVVEHEGVVLTLSHPRAQRLPVEGWYYRFEHIKEIERGLPARDDLYCPCQLRYELLPGEEVAIVAAQGNPVEAEERMEEPDLPSHDTIGRLKQAAASFIVESEKRASIIAGYPWFTDWGRDTMISLPGICLHTGRFELAKRILSDYASQMRQGLIPNRFAEHDEPEYNTVDGTLWFVNAAYRTLDIAWEEEFARRMLDSLREVFLWHMRGTLYGIRVDEADGLLTQGAPGTQLTWMDAKIGDWVVTPRRGKPVEINGLWINALRVMEWLATRLGEDPAEFRSAAQKAEASFEPKFWSDSLGYYLDTADPDDASLRPNQVIAMALPFGPAKGEHAVSALECVTRELLTPVGLRTLAPKGHGYKGRFRGPLPELDAAYHQGTVWPWLIGPYISALVRLTGRKAEAKKAVAMVREMLWDYGIGGLAEVYDGDEPRSAAGCPWQAWSVAEVLRVSVEDLT